MPGFSQFGFRTGAVPTPKHKLAAATPHYMTAVPPPQFAVVPARLDPWGNDHYGDCVSAEEAFAKAAWSVQCGLPELFVPTAEVTRWARAGGYLNGANLTDVMDSMARSGFRVDGQVYGDGAYQSVDFSNEAVLQSALSQGPVKLGMASASLPRGAGNQQGWYAVKPAPSRNEDHCFTSDTKVSLLDGRELSFAELAGGAAGDAFWVYSCDQDGNVVPGKAHSVRKTRSAAEIVRVTLDNGKSIRCTTDHRFLMRDGTYKKAKDLRADDSLMPLYRRVSKGGYELCHMPRLKGKACWRPTHRVVAFGPGCRSRGMHAHHVDLDKRNNAPENLRVMTPGDHSALHRHLSEYSRTPEHRARAKRLMKALWDDPVWAEAQRARLAASAPARGKKTVALGKNKFQTMTFEERSRHSRNLPPPIWSAASRKKLSETKRKQAAEDPVLQENLRSTALKASQAAALKPVTEKQREARRENMRQLRERRGQGCANNHKVVSVEPCGREDVYDLTVDGHHNFALTAGVFVHNCTGLSGYGPADFLYQQLGVAKPSGVSFPPVCYLFYTWSTLGVVSHDWIMGTVGEAWLRTPTTPGQTPAPPAPPTPPPPPPPPAVTLAQAEDWVSAGFDRMKKSLTPEQAKMVAVAALAAAWPR